MADSVFKQCLDAVQDSIQGLDLAQMPPANIVLKKIVYDKDVDFPAVFIYPLPERINPALGTNIHDQIEYGIGVTIAQKSDDSQTDQFERFLKWRQRIRSKFIHQRLTGVTEVNTCRVEPRDVIHPAGFADGYDVESMIVRCIAWETRG